MTALEWFAEIIVIALLAVTLPMAWRLNHMLRALRADRAALEQGAAGLGEAARQAEAALLRLRATTELAGRQVAERVAGAQTIAADLRYLLERSETLADRLEHAVHQARPLAGGTPAAPAAPAGVRSDAERDLIRALGLK